MKRPLWLALFAIMIGIPAFAGNGIPMGNAVFYPSVEAQYTHTDNLYMRDSSSPLGNISDSFWIIRPELGFEFPFKQSYVRLNLAYQYKDYETFQLSHHNTYYADFDSKFKSAGGTALTLQAGYIRGTQETKEFDPGYEVVFGNTPFNRYHGTIGLDLPVNQLNTVGIFGAYNTVDFRDASSTGYLPFFGYKQWTGGLKWMYQYSPLATFILTYKYTDSKPKNNAYDYTLYTNMQKQYHAQTFLVGWKGDTSRFLSGSIDLGFKNMKFIDNPYSDFSGFVADAGLHFKTSEFSGLDLKAYRQADQSAYNINNYYTATGGQLQIEHQVTRYFFWTAGYLYQVNQYPDGTVAVIDGQPLPYMFFATQGQRRRDKISRAYGEVGWHFTQQLSFRLNYRYEDRNSNVDYFDPSGFYIRPFTYAENRVSFQFLLGW